MTEKLERFSVSNYALKLPKTDIESAKKTNKPIIFDTNFLFITFEFHIDLISELRKLTGPSHTLFIYEGTIGELKNIERKKNKNKKFLPLIMKMLEIYNFSIITSKKSYIDDQILEHLDPRLIIATNDKALREKIKADNKSRVIYMRQRKYLEMV